MTNVRFAIVSGTRNGDQFTCGLEFCFNPLTCTRAAPKVEGLFVNKSLEACARIAKGYGFDFKLLPFVEDGDEHPGEKARKKPKAAIKIIRGDITTLNVDAIVNAANTSLLGGGGVDGAINRAAGDQLLRETSAIGPINTGQAVITNGYQLPSSHVIHTAGPVWQGLGTEKEKLYQSYNNCIDVAIKNNLTSVAFPAISCGVYKFPPMKAAEIAYSAAVRGRSLGLAITLCCFDESYEQYLITQANR